jgi:acetolactate synthase-1/3 small subunit
MLQTKVDGCAHKSDLSGDCILELRVKNHPGVMSHICGLFTRRAYNLEKIICLPIGGGIESRILLTVNAKQSLEQLIEQLRKLEDVVAVYRGNFRNDVFIHMENFLINEVV